jgi:hypothetical protein
VANALENPKNISAKWCFYGNFIGSRWGNFGYKVVLFKNMGRYSGLTEANLITWLVLIAGCLLVLSACAPQAVKASSVPAWPSEVRTQAGTIFFVRGLRIAGTNQDLRFRDSNSMIWLPLDQVVGVVFTGPANKDGYRQVMIVLTEGGQITGELWVDFLIEGTTDMGYWNMSMSKVDRLEIGTD